MTDQEAPRTPPGDAVPRKSERRVRGHAGRVLARRDRLVRLRRWREGDAWCSALRGGSFARTWLWAATDFDRRARLAGGLDPDVGASLVERTIGVPALWAGAHLHG